MIDCTFHMCNTIPVEFLAEEVRIHPIVALASPEAVKYTRERDPNNPSFEQPHTYKGNRPKESPLRRETHYVLDASASTPAQGGTENHPNPHVQYNTRKTPKDHPKHVAVAVHREIACVLMHVCDTLAIAWPVSVCSKLRRNSCFSMLFMEAVIVCM